MEDIISSLQTVYEKWEPWTHNAKVDSRIGLPERKISAPSLRASHDTRNRNQEKGKFSLGNLKPGSAWNGFRTEGKVVSLGQFKIMPTILPEVSAPKSRLRNKCLHCSPYIRKLLTDDMKSLGIRNILLLNTSNRDSGFLTRTFYQAAYALNLKTNFYYPDSSTKVLDCDRVKRAVENATSYEMEETGLEDKYYTRLMKKHQDRAAHILKTMKAKISSALLKFIGWCLLKTLRRMLSSIQVPKSQIEMLKRLSKSSVPIIYLPLHRSHLDYILVSFILVLNEVKAPLVAAGDNLNIPVFGPLLRGLGAFFIKRKLDPVQGRKDVVYRAILHTYMENILTSGHSVEFFIEGGRSRSGKACLPKAGLLSIVVDAFLDGSIKDAYIVPIGVSYEKLLDGKFISEQMGEPKVPESFISAIRGMWTVLCGNYGSARVDFSHPFSLREFVQASKSFVSTKPQCLLNKASSDIDVLRRNGSTTSLYGTDIVIEDQRLLIKGLAEHVLHDAACATALMSTNIVAFLLLNKYRTGVSLLLLQQDFNWLWDEILARGRDVGFSGTTKAIVHHALKLLGEKLAMVEKPSDLEKLNNMGELEFVKPNVTLPGVLELSYYSNVVLSTFLGDAVIASALFVLAGEELEFLEDFQSEVTISRQQLIEKSIALYSILQYEFILTPPCIMLESTINDLIQEFVVFDYLIDQSNCATRSRERQWADRFARNFELSESSEEEDEYFCDSRLKVNLRGDNVRKLRMFRNILAPFLEGYWHLGCSLKRLVSTEMEENRFIRITQKSMLEKIERGLLECPECVAADTLRNGIKLFESWRVLDSHWCNNIKIIYLADDYDNEEDIADVLRILEEFKK